MSRATNDAENPVELTLRTFDVALAEQADPREWERVEPLIGLSELDAEHVSLYRASEALQALRGDRADPRFAPGRATYLSLEYREPGSEQGDSRDSESIGPFVSMWALDGDARPVDARTVLQQDHVGIQIAYGLVEDPAWRTTIGAWYRDIHAPDVLGVEGVAGCVRFVVPDTATYRAGEHLVVFVLNDDPELVMQRVRAEVANWRAAGRTPSPGRASRALFNGPFLRVDHR